MGLLKKDVPKLLVIKSSGKQMSLKELWLQIVTRTVNWNQIHRKSMKCLRQTDKLLKMQQAQTEMVQDKKSSWCSTLDRHEERRKICSSSKKHIFQFSLELAKEYVKRRCAQGRSEHLGEYWKYKVAPGSRIRAYMNIFSTLQIGKSDIIEPAGFQDAQ